MLTLEIAGSNEKQALEVLRISHVISPRMPNLYTGAAFSSHLDIFLRGLTKTLMRAAAGHIHN